MFTFLKIWIFAPKLSFSETFCHYGGLSPKMWNSWFSTLCLHFQLFVYIVSCLFVYLFIYQLFVYFFEFSNKTLIFAKSFATKNSWFSAFCLHLSAVYLFIYQLFVYFFVSWLFTLSAVCLLFRIFKQNIEKSWLFCQNGDFKFLFWLLFCLHFQLFVYNFQLFVYNFFSWQCKQKCKQTAENHEFKLDILAKKSWNFNVFASNSKSKQTADCLHF